MKQHAEHEPELREYLLGGLMPDDALRVESRLFLEDDYSRMLKAAEDDLVDEYVNGELTAGEREKFELHFLSDPSRRDDVKVARALKRYIAAEAAAEPVGEQARRGFATPTPTPRPFFPLAAARGRWLGIAAGVAALLIIPAAAWYITRPYPPPPEVARVRESPTPAPTQPAPPAGVDPAGRGDKPAEEGAPGPGETPDARAGQTPTPSPDQGRERPDADGRQTRSPRPSPGEARPPSGALAVLLIPGGPTRDEGGLREINITQGRGALLLRLSLLAGSQSYRRYEATLYDEDGQAVRSWATLRPTKAGAGPHVAVEVPAGVLTPQRYQMKLRAALPGGGTRDVNSYHFRAVSK